MPKKRFLAAVLFVSCLLLYAAIPAFAEEGSPSAKAAGFRYGGLLSGAARDFYEALADQSGVIGGDVLLTFAHPPADSEELTESITAARAAYVYDYPQDFLMNGALDCDFFYSDGVITDAALKTGRLYETGCYASPEAAQKDARLLEKAVEKLPVTGSTLKEKALSIHDSLLSRVTYDKIAQKEILQNKGYAKKFRASEATGALLDGKAVCGGYAKAFKLVCDKAGVPCVIIFGNYKKAYHAWNYVQMENGRWYGVDLTNDDAATDPHAFFLLDADAMKNYTPAHATVSVALKGDAGI